MLVRLFNAEYRQGSVIFGTGAAIWSKLAFGLLIIVTLEVLPFCTYAPLPALLPFFKCILEVLFCIGFQYRL
jgi:hypothetical protein